jgi:hypothetical protein
MPNRFNWDVARRRYISAETGRAVRADTVNRWLREIGEGARSRMQSITARLSRGEISNGEWQLGMLREIKNGQSAMAILARGGKQQMTASDWGRVGGRIRAQNRYFLGFSSDVVAGQQSEAQMLNRAAQYADALYATYQNAVALRERAAGVTMARRVLDAGAQHCEDCPALATEEYVPIDEIVPIGDTACQVSCRCTIEYQEPEAGSENAGAEAQAA